MNEALIADPVRSKQILERIPAGRWGTAEDFEGAIVFLASRASDYVSGECLVVDGGWMGSEFFLCNFGSKLISFRIGLCLWSGYTFPYWVHACTMRIICTLL
jgi:hypothetical protein